MPNPKRTVRPSARRSDGPALSPMAVAGVVVLLGAGIALALWKKSDTTAAPSAGDSASGKARPFSDLGQDSFAHKPSAEGDAPQPFQAGGSANLALNETWQKALALAAEGEAVWPEVSAAKLDGDRTKLNEKARIAKDKFGTAFENTAQLEEDLIARLGEANPEVKQLVKTRSGWVKKLDWLLKHSGR